MAASCGEKLPRLCTLSHTTGSCTVAFDAKPVRSPANRAHRPLRAMLGTPKLPVRRLEFQ
jgi:hypothetical protein